MKFSMPLLGVSLALALAACGTTTTAPTSTAGSSSSPPATTSSSPATTTSSTTTATATNPTPEQATAAIVNGLNQMAPTLLANSGLSTTAKNAITDLTSIASAGLTSDVSSIGQSLIARVGNDAGAVLSEAQADVTNGTLTLTSTEQGLLTAGEVILPVLETGVEIASMVGVAPPPEGQAMTPAEAYALLMGAKS